MATRTKTVVAEESRTNALPHPPPIVDLDRKKGEPKVAKAQRGQDSDPGTVLEA